MKGEVSMKRQPITLIIALLCATCLIVGACAPAEETDSEGILDRPSESGLEETSELSVGTSSGLSHLSGDGLPTEFADSSVEKSGDIDVIPFPSGAGSWDFMTKDLGSFEGMSPEEALQAFLDQYENYSGSDWARIGCAVKITVSTEATTEAREALLDTMRTLQRRTYQFDREHEYALLAKLYYIPSADGLITEYYADATAQAIRALQSIKGVSVVIRDYEDIPDSAVECRLYEN